MTYTYRLTARNYATGHENRIHSDETAGRYGFSGGLVPGVAFYAYLTLPIVEALGRDWLSRGWATVKFLKPIYDGAEIEARAIEGEESPLRCSLEIHDQAGALAVVGEASLPARLAPPDPLDYEWRELPAREHRKPATIDAVRSGDILGSHEFDCDPALAQEAFLEEIGLGEAGEAIEIYRGAEAVLHPARLLSEANELIARNIALGPWIHTSSAVQHYALAEPGERLALRGRVMEAGRKRGHDYLVADLALFGNAERPLAAIRHSALIRLREPDAPPED